MNGTYHLPTIPGHEFAGIVREVKDIKDQHLVGETDGGLSFDSLQGV